MTEYLDLSVVEPMTDSLTFSQELDLPPTPEPFSDVAATSPATSYEGSTNAHPPLWRANPSSSGSKRSKMPAPGSLRLT
jgi:hypothetical protein